MLRPEEIFERGFSTVIVAFILFLQYIFVGLLYFIPIDLTWKYIGKMPAILLGAACLYMWSLFIGWSLIRSYKDRE